VASSSLLDSYASVLAADIYARVALHDAALFSLYLQVAAAWAEEGLLDDALRVYGKALRLAA
jgi:hypothetical protein